MKKPFTISSKTVYTIKSTHGVIHCDGVDGLTKHGENTLGAFVDNACDGLGGYKHRNKVALFDYIMAHRDDLQTILELLGQIDDIANPTDVDDEDD